MKKTGLTFAVVMVMIMTGSLKGVVRQVPVPYATIQAAINDCNDGDIVRIANGTYTGEGNRDIDFDGKAITVESENGYLNCGIDCGGSASEPHRGFIFQNNEGPNSVVSGLTIMNGYADWGGAIYCIWGSPTITDCRIILNTAVYDGGAIYGGDGPINNCGIGSNTAGSDGGGLARCDGTISNCIIRGNTATGGSSPSGGGLYRCDGTISNCLISNNHADSYGGGLSRCDGTISNCKITNNTAGDYGGGVEECGGLVINCTIVENTATTNGNALSSCHGAISNCIIWDNGSSDKVLFWSSIPLYSCVQGGSDGTGCTGNNPLFVDPGLDDYRLNPGSPCINTGKFAYCMSLPCSDLDGNLRNVGLEIDMGCYEYKTTSGLDSDGDWLEDSSEPGYENDPDRDSDGLVDGIELMLGTNLFNPDPPIDWNVPSPNTPTIQKALFFSREGEQITVQTGTYKENILIGGRNIILKSTNPDNPSVVSATNIDADTDNNAGTANGRVVAFLGTENANCQILGLRIINGDDVMGGGIYGAGTLAGIIDCMIDENNSQDRGGGVYDCDGEISNCSVVNNTSSKGGGLCRCDGQINFCSFSYNDASTGGAMADCQGTINNGFIQYNSANYGGALYNCDGTIINTDVNENTAAYNGGGLYDCDGIISLCTILDNTADENGGGLFQCQATISTCAIIGNTASTGQGGGLYFEQDSTAEITNCTITENMADVQGGSGIHCDDSDLTVTNCTISGNGQDSYGGAGFWCRNDSYATVHNCIISHNNNNYYQFVCNTGSTADVSYSDIWDWSSWPGEGNMNRDPCFVSVIGGDFHLADNSPCINTADPCDDYSGQLDMDHQPRLIGPRVDMGSDEVMFYYTLTIPATCGGTTDPAPMTQIYSGGSPIEVTAVPSAYCPFELDHWKLDGADADPNNPYSIVMNADHVLYPVFTLTGPTCWQIVTVDSNDDVGFDTSVALDNGDNPHISYYDDANGDLKYAYYDDGWHTETVDSDGDVGLYTSIATDSNNNPHISYLDATNVNLKYACYDPCVGWNIETADNNSNVGEYTSIAIDSNDNPHISYLDTTNWVLKYTYYDPCNGWNIETVGGDSVGGYSSIALDSNDNPHISYYSSGNLKYACKDGTWFTETADSNASVGWYSSIATDSNDNPHISYYDAANNDLKYARKDGTWNVEIVDSDGDVGQYNCLALDSNDRPHISYHRWTGGALKYARKDSVWYTEIVDSDYAAGEYTSIALDTGNVPHISYYFLFMTGNLKFATPDYDGDDVAVYTDKCPDIYDPNQIDADLDGIGDLCECYAANVDGADPVDFEDFAELAFDWLLTGSGLVGDTDGNGTVDFWDVAQLAQQWLCDCHQPVESCCP
ncbi:MAG: choice-of-anchor Q domain-containing protein [Planctomycetota bacterium]|jgi:hypothetical protein